MKSSKKWMFIFIAIIVYSCTGHTKKNTHTTSDTSYLGFLNESIKNNPKVDSLYFLRASYWLEKRNLSAALTDIRKAIELNPTLVKYHLLLADIYLASGNVTNARNALIKASDLEKNNVEPLLKLAELSLFERDYKMVDIYCKAALDIDPINGKAEFIKGYALLEQKDTVEGIKHLKKATINDPEYYEAFSLLGVILMRKKDPLAGSYLKTAVRLRPNSIEARYNYGLWLQETFRFEEAMKQYEAILSIQPNNKYAWYNMGYIQLVYLKNFEKAIFFFNKVLEIDSLYVDALYNRGLSYQMLGNRDLAKQDYQKVLRLVENHPKAIERMNEIIR
ncbi:MAG: tetratricopeptide repeat protein [Bacteroidales bacterium]|nr:tetratricopeptide repeat protein [Bacteroidales bacterium]